MIPSWNSLYKWGQYEERFVPDSAIFESVERSSVILSKIINEDKQLIYGLHTGYGSNVTDLVSDQDWQEHQLHLLNYLHVGQGAFFDEKTVRRALRLQAYKVGLGYSGVHPLTFKALLDLADSENLPKVPMWGSLGASGDLIPMAHAIAPIFSHRKPSGPRDVIALVNTNAMMASYAIDTLEAASEVVEISHKITGLVGWSLGLQSENQAPWSLSVQAELAWSHQSAKKIEAFTTKYIEENACELSKDWRSQFPIQEKYSIRCAPQILGNALENLSISKAKILREAVAIADNPLIPAFSDQSVAHGGLFYTSYLATAADLLNDILFRACEILDRQVLILMDSSLSHGLPGNLEISRYDHCKGLHQLISSLMQLLRAKATPSRLLSFSCEGNNQDVVPCSMNAFHLVNENLLVSQKITHAAMFVAQRACLLAAQKEIPKELTLDHFKSQSGPGIFPGQNNQKKEGEVYEFC